MHRRDAGTFWTRSLAMLSTLLVPLARSEVETVVPARSGHDAQRRQSSASAGEQVMSSRLCLGEWEGDRGEGTSVIEGGHVTRDGICQLNRSIELDQAGGGVG